MKDPKVSLIIPVYNVSAHLRRCLNSAVQQTLDEIEIILVNDHSPDPMDEIICQEFAHKDKRIKYIRHSNNRRQGGARNSGLEIATGDYIWFIDSDDFVDINACEFLYSQAKAVDVDVLAFSAIDYLDSPKTFRVKNGYHYHARDISLLGKVYSGKDFIESSLSKNNFYVTCWSHLFRKQLIAGYRFREGVYREDTDLIPIVIYNAKSVYCIKYAPYYRLIREHSDTQQELSEKIVLDKFSYLKSLISYVKTKKLDKNDPLKKFTSRQLQYTTKLYKDYKDKTDKTERAYSDILMQCVNSIFSESHRWFDPYSISPKHLRIWQTLKSNILKIKRER